MCQSPHAAMAIETSRTTRICAREPGLRDAVSAESSSIGSAFLSRVCSSGNTRGSEPGKEPVGFGSKGAFFFNRDPQWPQKRRSGTALIGPTGLSSGAGATACWI